MDKANLKLIAKDTVKISEDGYYYFNDNKVVLESPKSALITRTRLCAREKYRPTNIVVNNLSTLDMIYSLEHPENAGALNFASAKHPGGGFLNGTMAQEESLAYRSNLYSSLIDFRDTFYKYHLMRKSPLYSDMMIFGKVSFFKDDSFNLRETPTTINVLTSAAVNAGEARKAGMSQERINRNMKDRMRQILYIFANKKCNDIILGAFGAGVFKNNPEDVARMWKELLIDEELKKYFENIYFSIYDKRPSTIESFRKYFE